MTQGPLSLMTSYEVGVTLARRVKELRLLKNMKRTTLAENAGVSIASLKRFETSGKISLDSFLKLAQALCRLDEFDELLKPPKVRSIDELEQRATAPIPKRGRK